jgi:hypothetical protein
VPVPVPYANLTNPQTLNLYAMVVDDPESLADFDGHAQTADEFRPLLADTNRPKPAGRLSLLARILRAIFVVGPRTRAFNGEIALTFTHNTLAAGENLGRRIGYVVTGRSGLINNLEPEMVPQTDADEKNLEILNFALLFVPGFEEEGAAAEEHHIATWYGRYGQIFKDIFEEAGMDIKNEAENLMDLAGHSGRHTTWYHQHVLRTIRRYTDGLTGEGFKRGLIRALRSIRTQLEDNPRLPYEKGAI